MVPLPTSDALPTDLWFAGFFDGEGCISAYKVKGSESYSCLARVSNTHLPSLQLFKSRFGGSIYMSKSKRRARPCFTWQVGGKDLDRFLLVIQPLLYEKGRQVELMMRLRSSPCPKWRAKLAAGIKELKRPVYTL